MSRDRKLETPVTLFAAIEASQHEALRQLAFKERRSVADLVRDAIGRYIKETGAKPKRRSAAHA